MDLRSSNHLHYIKTARGGLVTRVLNISRGRPALVFKCVKDLYENTKMLSLCPVQEAKDDVNCLAVDSDDVNVQNHCVPGVCRRIFKVTENSGVNCGRSDEKGDSDLEETEFGSITLKQIKEKCKGKKRKRTTVSKLNKGTAETCSELLQDYFKIQEEEDEHDLPLSCWKSKISKKKAKRKSVKNYSATLLEGVETIVKSEQFYNYDEQYKSVVLAPTDVEVTVSTSDHSDGLEAISVGNDSSFGSNEVEILEVDCIEAQSTISVAVNFSEGCNENVDCSLAEISKSKDSSLNCDENVSCSALEISDCDCSDAQIAILVPTDSPFDCNQNADSCGDEVIDSNCSDDNNIICIVGESLSTCKETECDGAISSTLLKAADEGILEAEASLPFSTMECDGVISSTSLKAADEDILEAEVSLPFSTEPQSHLVDECHVYMEPADSKLLPHERDLMTETMWKQNPDSIDHQCPELPVPECTNEGYIGLHISNNLSSDTISLINNFSAVFHISPNYPSMTKMPCQTNSEPKIEVPDIAIGTSLRHGELSDVGAQCTFEKGSEDNLHTNYEANAVSIPLRSMSDSSASVGNDLSMAEEKQATCVHGCLASVDSNLLAAEEKQPLLHTVADASRDSPQLNPSVVTDDLEGLPGDGNCECTQLQHAPKRLLSARKSISPISRKRLCKALESDGCCIKEPHECDGEHCFEKQTTTEINSVGDPNQIKRTESETSTSHKTKKPKDEKKGSPPKRKLKVSLLSRAIPSLSSGCDSIQICTENAIAFSQQQMRDIERIATRLTEELRTMKDIVEERLCSQTSPTKSPKRDADEVRIAIANAEKAEETTQRWLTMMTKDCKRFCKIMSLTEKNSVAIRNAVHLPCLTEKDSVVSGNAVGKKRKKITFADEAGGKLCHVKIFDDEDGFSGRNQLWSVGVESVSARVDRYSSCPIFLEVLQI